MTIVLSSLLSLNVALVSLLIIASIYLIRFVLLRVFIGKDIMPQLFVAPRGLITVLLFYAIPKEAEIATFESGILLFVIIATSLVMTWAMIKSKKQLKTPLEVIDNEIAAKISKGEGEEIISAEETNTNQIEKEQPDTDKLNDDV